MTGSLPFLKTYQSFLSFVHWVVSYFLRAGPSFPNIRSKRLINIQITVLSSSIAKPFPGQLAGPWENGINAERLSLVPLTLSFWWDLLFSSWRSGCCDASNQRSGQNTSGRGEKLFLSRWITNRGTTIAVLGGGVLILPNWGQKVYTLAPFWHTVNLTIFLRQELYAELWLGQRGITLNLRFYGQASVEPI